MLHRSQTCICNTISPLPHHFAVGLRQDVIQGCSNNQHLHPFYIFGSSSSRCGSDALLKGANVCVPGLRCEGRNQERVDRGGQCHPVQWAWEAGDESVRGGVCGGPHWPVVPHLWRKPLEVSDRVSSLCSVTQAMRNDLAMRNGQSCEANVKWLTEWVGMHIISHFACPHLFYSDLVVTTKTDHCCKALTELIGLRPSGCHHTL